MLIDMIIFFAIMLVAVFLLTDILQLFISLRYKPYIEYPVKDAGLAVVYFYQLARGGRGNYSGYKFVTRNEKWRYCFTRSDLIGLVSFFTIFILAFVLTTIMRKRMRRNTSNVSKQPSRGKRKQPLQQKR